MVSSIVIGYKVYEISEFWFRCICALNYCKGIAKKYFTEASYDHEMIKKYIKACYVALQNLKCMAESKSVNKVINVMAIFAKCYEYRTILMCTVDCSIRVFDNLVSYSQHIEPNKA